MNKSTVLKKLKSRKSTIENDINLLKAEQSEISRKMLIEKKELEKINEQIKKLKNDNGGKDIIITEHALLRYLERIKGINLENLINEIIPKKIKEQICILGNGKFPINGYILIIKNNEVITIDLKDK